VVEWPEITAVQGSYSLAGMTRSKIAFGFFGALLSIFCHGSVYEAEDFSPIMRIVSMSFLSLFLILMVWMIFASVWLRVIALEVDGYGFRYITRRGTQQYRWMDIESAYFNGSTPLIVVRDVKNKKRIFELPSHAVSKVIMEACKVRGKLRPDHSMSF
jgi:hypothetical protein